MAKTFTEELSIDRVNVKVEVRRLNHGTKSELRNFFGKYGIDPENGNFDDFNLHIGSIETIVFKRAIESVVVGGEKVKFNSPNPIQDLPEDVGMGDEEDSKDLYEEIFKVIVKHNPWLGRRAPFVLVFGQYLASVERAEADAEDPTESAEADSPADTSTGRIISGSELKGSEA